MGGGWKDEPHRIPGKGISRWPVRHSPEVTEVDGEPVLTYREKVFLRRMINEGTSLRATARAMDVPEATASTWMRTARLRLGVATTRELRTLVIERGLLEEES